MGKKRRKKSYVGDFIMIILLAALLLIFFQRNNISSPGDLFKYAQSKVPAVKHCLMTGECGRLNVKELFERKDYNVKVDFGGKLETPDFSGADGEKQIVKSLENLQVKEFTPPENYNRSDWRHWDNVEGSNCWNVREEVLYNSGSSVKVLDKNKKETRKKEDACYVLSGSWVDPYSGETITNPREIDIDHIVPLYYAEAMGAADWTPAQKQMFANDPVNLTISSARENRQKGASGPGEWMPTNKHSHCEYAKRFLAVIEKYGLSVTPADKKALESALALCE